MCLCLVFVSLSPAAAAASHQESCYSQDPHRPTKVSYSDLQFYLHICSTCKLSYLCICSNCCSQNTHRPIAALYSDHLTHLDINLIGFVLHTVLQYANVQYAFVTPGEYSLKCTEQQAGKKNLQSCVAGTPHGGEEP